MRKFGSRLTDVVLVAVLLAGGFWTYQNHNQLLDWYYLRDYTPPQAIATLADQATMTEQGKHLFYRAQPQIDMTRAALVTDCRIPNDKTIELGCYLSTDKIYLLNIQQPELKNEMIVTAAHETLHAAYDRMSASDKREISSELEQYAKTITDASFKQRMQQYRETEPGEEDNELHSIVGTEFGNLPSGLEQHYALYFSNRAQIVSYSDQFNTTFDGLHTQITQLDSQIKATKARMEALKAANRIREYNALVDGVNADINSYNGKVQLYNQYASELLGTESAAGVQ